MTYTDERGTIEDIIGPVDCVTRILTKRGAVRGNHVHLETRQWTFVVSGLLVIVSGNTKCLLEPGQMMFHEAGEAHAWQAKMDTDCLVFTKGPRGEDYESDTIRLDTPLL